MKPPSTNKKFTSSQRTIVLSLVIFLAVLLVILGILLGLLLRQRGFQFSLPARATETPVEPVIPTTVIPTLFVPTPDCGPASLAIGTTTFQIQTIDPVPDGSLSVPSDTPGIVYWVGGADGNRVFVLPSMGENQALLSSLAAGGEATVTLSNCDVSIHTLAAPEQGFLNTSSVPDQGEEGITLFFQTDTSGNGYVVRGDLRGEEINVFNLPPASGGTEVQAEIGLLGTTASSDGATIQVEVSILNYGGSALTVTVDDVTLALEASVAFQPLDSQPSLPREVQPGATEMFTFTFPRPPTPTATLRVFTIEYELDGY